MLSPYDLDLARRDPALPGLATLLDPDAFVAALAGAAPARPIDDAQISYVKYKPGTNCLVGYRLRIDGALVDGYARAGRLPIGDNPRRSGWLALPDQQIDVALFPEDRRLGGLRRLDDDRGRRRLLRALLPDRAEWHAATLHRLVYKPERRFVARLDVAGTPRAVLKFHTASGYSAALRACTIETRAPLHMARVLGHDERSAALAYAWLDGRLLLDALTDSRLDRSALERVGAALASLHAQPPGALPRWTIDHDVHALLAAADAVAHVSPLLADRAFRLARQIAADLARMPAGSALIHGDFYAKQVLLNGDAVALIDFDEAARGDPAIDLGNFVAHLERDVLRGVLTPQRRDEARDALLDGYVTHRRSLPDSINLRVAASLLLLTPHPFRHREADWPEQTEALLDRAALLAAQSRREVAHG